MTMMMTMMKKIKMTTNEKISSPNEQLHVEPATAPEPATAEQPTPNSGPGGSSDQPLSPAEQQAAIRLAALTPRQIVAALDRYIVGQPAAKRAVAVALRNRYRRQQLAEEMRDDVSPKNILMIGPTGVGKTEIARRVAKLIDAPFIKVEATKFTEVGYVGRDVESIIRDLTDIAFGLVHDEKLVEVKGKAEEQANEKLISYIVASRNRASEPPKPRRKPAQPAGDEIEGEKREAVEVRRNPAQERKLRAQRQQVAQLLASQQLEEETIEIDLDAEEIGSMVEFMPGMGSDDLPESFHDFMEGLRRGGSHRQRKLTVREARRLLTHEESHKLLDFDAIIEQAIKRVQDHGVVFLDELDKIVGSEVEVGPDVSNEGVQRDLLPIVEGSTVNTRYGPVKSDHILFIAAGAFHDVKPSDLIPELQGRFPLRVELDSLSQDDLEAILVQPENSLTKQYVALLATEQVELEFTSDGLRRMAEVAAEVNERTEDIGARRLHTIIEKVLEEISFDAPERPGERFVVDAAYVDQRITDLVEDEDLSKFIL